MKRKNETCQLRAKMQPASYYCKIAPNRVTRTLVFFLPKSQIRWNEECGTKKSVLFETSVLLQRQEFKRRVLLFCSHFISERSWYSHVMFSTNAPCIAYLCFAVGEVISEYYYFSYVLLENCCYIIDMI